MAAEETPRPGKVLIIYVNAPEDKELLKQLNRHMSPLKRRELIEEWSIADIPAGKDWKSDLDNHLHDADIILLLVSPDFIASDYYESIKMLLALTKQEEGKTLIIPILLRPTDYANLPFANLRWLPSDSAAVTRWPDIDSALYQIVTSIDDLIQGRKNLLSLPDKTLPRYWSVPYRKNPFFSARQSDLDELYNRFTIDRDDFVVVQAITGLPGIGKTELALEYAFRYRGRYKAVFWLKYGSSKDLIAGFLRIADLLQLPIESASEEQDVIAWVKQRLMNFNEDWLLIFDNVSDLTSIHELIPESMRGDVLITTAAADVEEFALPLKLSNLNEEEGAHLLLRRARITTPSRDDLLKAQEISRLVDGLPLALNQAGAYINGTGKSLSDYIQNYRTRLNERGQDTTNRHPETVTATFSFCFEQIQQSNPIAEEILKLCAFLNAEAIPEKLFTTGIPELGPVLQSLSYHQLEEAFQALRRYSLVVRDDGMLSIHRLVQLVLQDGMSEEEQRLLANRAVHAIEAIFPDPVFALWPLCRSYLPQAQACADLMKRWEEIESLEGARLLNKAGCYLYEQSQYAAARSFFEQALKIQQRVLEPDHPDRARTLTHLGELSRSLVRYPEAKKYYRDAQAILNQLPDQPLALAQVLDDQGELAQTQEQFSQAQKLYKRAFTIRKKRRPGPDSPEIAASLANLAGIHEELGDASQAGKLYDQARALYERTLVPDHPALALLLSNMARFYGDQKDYTRAEELFERAKAIREQKFGPDHPKVAGTLHNLAAFYIDSGDPDKYMLAGQYIRRALAIWEQGYGTQMHPDVAASIRILARLYHKQRNYDDAESNYKQALAIYEQLPEPKHLAIAQLHQDLEELRRDRELDEQAKKAPGDG